MLTRFPPFSCRICSSIRTVQWLHVRVQVMEAGTVNGLGEQIPHSADSLTPFPFTTNLGMRRMGHSRLAPTSCQALLML